MPDKPSAIEMIANKPTIEERVEKLLLIKRSYTGSNNELEFAFRRRYSSLKLTFKAYEDIFHSISSESISRARRKVQRREKDKIEQRLAELGFSRIDKEGKIIIIDEPGYANLKEKLILENPYLPLPKTLNKRDSLENANRAYYSDGQTRLE